MKRMLWPLLALAVVLPAHAHDYPTIDRVEYVHECMRANQGPRQEMIYKCSCAIDSIAADMPYEEFVDASTAANAVSIAGERGSYIRDAQMTQDLVSKYRAAQSKAKKSCFIH